MLKKKIVKKKSFLYNYMCDEIVESRDSTPDLFMYFNANSFRGVEES